MGNSLASRTEQKYINHVPSGRSFHQIIFLKPQAHRNQHKQLNVADICQRSGQDSQINFHLPKESEPDENAPGLSNQSQKESQNECKVQQGSNESDLLDFALRESKSRDEGITELKNFEGKDYYLYSLCFEDSDEYEDFMNTLIYRWKAMEKSSITKINTMYVEKGGCISGKYFAYFFEEKYTNRKQFINFNQFLSSNSNEKQSLDQGLFNFSKGKYEGFYEILTSLSKTLARYQSKRLRYGKFDPENIYISKKLVKKSNKPDHMTENVSPSHYPHYPSTKFNSYQWKNQRTTARQSLLQVVDTRESKVINEFEYHCVVRDTYIKDCLQSKMKRQKQRKVCGQNSNGYQEGNQLSYYQDFYKEDVKKMIKKIKEFISCDQIVEFSPNHERKKRVSLRENYYFEKLSQLCDKNLDQDELKRYNWKQVFRFLVQNKEFQYKAGQSYVFDQINIKKKFNGQNLNQTRQRMIPTLKSSQTRRQQRPYSKLPTQSNHELKENINSQCRDEAIQFKSAKDKISSHLNKKEPQSHLPIALSSSRTPKSTRNKHQGFQNSQGQNLRGNNKIQTSGSLTNIINPHYRTNSGPKYFPQKINFTISNPPAHGTGSQCKSLSKMNSQANSKPKLEINISEVNKNYERDLLLKNRCEPPPTPDVVQFQSYTLKQEKKQQSMNQFIEKQKNIESILGNGEPMKELQKLLNSFRRDEDVRVFKTEYDNEREQEREKEKRQQKRQQNGQKVSEDGYGMVENPFWEFPKSDEKIDYQDLFNLGRFWTRFEGNFNRGNKEGPGIIYLSNGQIFNGTFKDDLANGKGTVCIEGQTVLKGIWKDNILVTKF